MSKYRSDNDVKDKAQDKEKEVNLIINYKN